MAIVTFFIEKHGGHRTNFKSFNKLPLIKRTAREGSKGDGSHRLKGRGKAESDWLCVNVRLSLLGTQAPLQTRACQNHRRFTCCQSADSLFLPALAPPSSATLIPSRRHKNKAQTPKWRLCFVWLPLLDSNQRPTGQKHSRAASAIASCGTPCFFLLRRRLPLPLAAAVPEPVNSRCGY